MSESATEASTEQFTKCKLEMSESLKGKK